MKERARRRPWLAVPKSSERFVTANGSICRSDALTFLLSLPDATADIVFMDPPFNLGKKYGRRENGRDSIDEVEYLRYMSQVLSRAVQVLRPGGALYLYHLPRWAVIFANFLSSQLVLRHWIAVSMKNGYPSPGRLYPAHYALLYFSKGKPAVFKRPKLPVPVCRHCEKALKDYGGYWKYVQSGLNLSDVWDDLSPVRHRKFKLRRANELPGEIPDRVVQISGRRGGFLVDPFAGTGGALIAAADHGMRFAGCDLEPQSYRIMVGRMKTLLKQEK